MSGSGGAIDAYGGLPGGRCGWPTALVTAALLWAVYLLVAGSSTLWDRDEPRYATASIEMVRSGNYLYPTFNHELRPHKPAGIYWLMSAGIGLFGATELGVRLPSTIALVLCALMTYWIGRQLGGPRVGWWSMLILATNPMVIYNGMAATTDATLMVGILAAQLVFVRAWLHGPRWWHVGAMGLALAFAQLIKGPVGLLLPVLGCGVALWYGRGRWGFAGARERGPRGWVVLLLAALIGTGGFLAWAVPANAATGGEYGRVGVVHRLGRRLFTAMEGHGAEGWKYLFATPFYFVTVIVAFIPWTLLLPGALRCLLGRRLSVRPELGPGDAWATSGAGLRVLLVSMILPAMIFMTLVVSKLPHYILPVFPWLAITVALVLERARRGDMDPGDRAWLRNAGLAAPLLGVVGGAMVLGPWVAWLVPGLFPGPLGGQLAAARSGGLLGGLALLATSVVATRELRAGRLSPAAGALSSGMLGLTVVLATLLMPVAETITKPGPTLGRQLVAFADSGLPVGQHGWYEPSIHFYLRGPRVERLDEPAQVRAWVEQPGPRLLIITREGLDACGGEAALGDLEHVGTGAGLCHVKGRHIELLGYVRRSS